MSNQLVSRYVEPRVLDTKLASRTAIERARAQNAHWFRRHPSRHKIEKCIAKPMLNLGLRLAGLYSRGVQNALRPVVRKIQVSFPDLPFAFDGFQLLHLSDLHIDGIQGLPETVIDAISDLTPDLCVM